VYFSDAATPRGSSSLPPQEVENIFPGFIPTNKQTNKKKNKKKKKKKTNKKKNKKKKKL